MRSRLFRWRISRLERGHRIDLLKSRLERRRNREEGLVILAALGRLVPALNWWQRDRALDALTACVARTDVASGALEILLAIAAESPDDSLRERVAEELAEALHRVFDDARIPVVRALGEVEAHWCSDMEAKLQWRYLYSPRRSAHRRLSGRRGKGATWP